MLNLRKKSSERGIWITPTSPQLKIVLIGDDYEMKVSIRKNKDRAIADPASETRYVRPLIQIVLMRISSQLIVNLLSTNCCNECLC